MTYLERGFGPSSFVGEELRVSDKEFLAAVGAIAAATIAGVAAFLGKGKSAPAETQEVINEGFKHFMTEADKRITQLEKLILEKDSKIITLEGEINALEQWARSMESLMRAAGMDIPTRPTPTRIPNAQLGESADKWLSLPDRR